ncbi:MAG: hypothetical protein AAB701_00965 [Patescibacteria group bacterium]
MAKKKNEEREAAVEAEATTEADVLNTGDQLVDEEQLDAAASEAETDSDAAVPAELAALHTDTVVAKEASTDKKATRKTTQPTKRDRIRSARYLKASEAFEKEKTYKLEQALELAQQVSYSTFVGSIELHARIAVKKGKTTEGIRGLVQLPHGTGKTINAVILTEEIIDQITKTKQVPYDTLIAPKSLMPKVAAIAKILGPIGKMPSPKAGTVADNPDDVLKAIQSGRVEYRTDASNNIHLTIGKVDWELPKLLENAQAAIGALPKNQLMSLTVTASMGPGIRIDINSL